MGVYLEGIICELGIGVETMLVDALEHAFDHGILRLVELTDFALNAPSSQNRQLVHGDESGLQRVRVRVLRRDVDGRNLGVV